MLIKINNKLGFWQEAWKVQGWSSFGPVCCYCNSEADARELMEEYVHEDSYARVGIFHVNILKEIDAEEAEAKHKARMALSALAPKQAKGLLYGWDGTILEFFKGTSEQFNHFGLFDLVAGQKLVWWNEDNQKHSVHCNYPTMTQVMFQEVANQLSK